MARTELRNKQNTWFQKRNHVRPAKNQVSKKYIDPVLGTSSGGGGTPPIPSQGIVGHYVADVANLNVNPDDTVAEWRDISGNDRHAVGTTFDGRSSPTWDGTHLNFDGQNRQLDFPAGTFTGVNVQTVLMVLSFGASIIDRNSLDNPHINNFAMLLGNTAPQWYVQQGESVVRNWNINPFDYVEINGDRADTQGLFQETNRYIPTILEADELFVLSGVGTDTDGTPLTPTALLNRETSNGRGIDGLCAEIIFYDRKLTEQEVQDATTALMAKWNITPSHPQSPPVPDYAVWLDPADIPSMGIDTSGELVRQQAVGAKSVEYLAEAARIPMYDNPQKRMTYKFVNNNLGNGADRVPNMNFPSTGFSAYGVIKVNAKAGGSGSGWANWGNTLDYSTGNGFFNTEGLIDGVTGLAYPEGRFIVWGDRVAPSGAAQQKKNINDELRISTGNPTFTGGDGGIAHWGKGDYRLVDSNGGDFIMFERQLSDTEHQAMMDWLYAKWDITNKTNAAAVSNDLTIDGTVVPASGVDGSTAQLLFDMNGAPELPVPVDANADRPEVLAALVTSVKALTDAGLFAARVEGDNIVMTPGFGGPLTNGRIDYKLNTNP